MALLDKQHKTDKENDTMPLKTYIKISIIFNLILFSSAIMAGGQQATVGLIRGEVNVITHQDNPQPLKLHDKISIGSTIQTTAKSFVQLLFNDRSILHLKANSKVHLTDYHFDKATKEKDSLSIELLKGSMRTISGLLSQRSPNTVQYKTPVSVVGIRGTAIELSDTHVTFDFGHGYTHPINQPDQHMAIPTGHRVHFVESPDTLIKITRHKNDPVSWVKRLEFMPHSDAHEHVKEHNLELSEIIFLVALLQHHSNLSGDKLHQILKGFHHTLPVEEQQHLTRLSLHIYPHYEAKIRQAEP